jgi:diguanylate cyclase (GGDEF)-like protein
MADDHAGSTGDHRDPAADRDRTAEDRDRRAEAHDQESDVRDERAKARDERAEARERTAEVVDKGAVADRKGALRDRQGGASDRTQAADDCKASSTDRGLAAQERADASTDELTQAYRRDAGIVQVAREIARAKRTNQRLTLAFVDVDKLKGINDSRGHAAGDRLLRDTADSIRAHLRSYDLIIRFGGDEFLCALPAVTAAQAAERFSLINADLAATHQTSVTVGLAELQEDDVLEDLIARADDAMYRQRQETRSPGA